MKFSVGVLGATGFVGRTLLERLDGDERFEVSSLMASERSVGRVLCGRVIESCEVRERLDIVFSALDAAVAGEIEERFARAGSLVISNAKSHRWHPDVPLLIPEVNSHHLTWLERQPWEGGIVTTPNCVVIPLCIALQPLHARFRVESVKVVTLQAISGGGDRGVAAMDIQDNVIPYINGEQQKIETEPFKIMGWERDEVTISAQCNRVPVSHGHTLCVSVAFEQKPSVDEVREVLSESCVVHDDRFYPQPRRHRDIGNGMAVSVGQIERCPLLGYRFVITAHNAIRGAAGNAILTAEHACGEPV